MSDIKFTINEPHILKLSDTTPDLDGMNWAYSTDKGTLSIPERAAVKIGKLFLEAGEEFSIGRYRQNDGSPAEWVVSLTARTERARAAKETSELERQLAASLPDKRPVQSVPPTREAIRATGTHGPVQIPRISARGDRGAPQQRVSYRVALREITGAVTGLLRETGEQWNDQAKQDLVSTAFISAAKAGAIAFDFQVEDEAK